MALTRLSVLDAVPQSSTELYRTPLQGKHEVVRLDLCTVLLMDDVNYPCWLVLVPRRHDIKVHARWMPSFAALRHAAVLQLHTDAGWLQQNHTFPAQVLPPKQAAAMHMQEVIELDDKDQRKLWEEVSRVCRALKYTFAPGLKLNIAAIGNVVSNPPDHLSLRGLVYLAGCAIAYAHHLAQLKTLRGSGPAMESRHPSQAAQTP